MKGGETVHIGGVDVRPAAQQHLHLAPVPGGAGRKEYAPIAEPDLQHCCQLNKSSETKIERLKENLISRINLGILFQQNAEQGNNYR